ncbi:MAG: isocitrate lyase/phosphoenolpyruvate mutase family protein [Desulfobacterales bacterium]|nr:isocitrate lyase/phosphoenolpyruvate mutase family protein [Desulfobacterales bacterium]
MYSFNDAIRRAEAYAEAGADAIFIEAPSSIEEIEKIPKLLPGIHLVINMVEGSEKTPLLDLNDIKSMGYSLILYPISMLLASIKWMKFVLKTLKQDGSTKLAEEYMSSFSEMFQTVDLQYYRNLEKNF